MPKRLYALVPSTEEKEQLAQQLKRTGGSVLEYKWAQIIWLSAIERMAVQEIAQQVHLSVVRTRLRIRKWNGRRMLALQQGRSPGRPRKATKEAGAQIAQAAAQAHPSDYG